MALPKWQGAPEGDGPDALQHPHQQPGREELARDLLGGAAGPRGRVERPARQGRWEIGKISKIGKN